MSGGELIALAILSVVFGVLGYWLSEKDRRQLGRTPWGLPSALWAFFWFLSLALGLILYLIAHVGEVRRSRLGMPPDLRPQGGSPIPMAGRSADRPLTVAEQFPAYPRPANTRPVPPEPDASPEVAAQPVGSPFPEAAASSPAAWHPDPSGRFHHRWWDGSQWTNQVSTDGHHLIDTNPDQRIGPY